MFKKIYVCLVIVLFSVTTLAFASSNQTIPKSKQSLTSGKANIKKTITLSVPSMTCSVCPITVRKALEGVSGVSHVSVNFKDKTAKVTFSPDKVSETTLTKATANSGYPSTIKKSKK